MNTYPEQRFAASFYSYVGRPAWVALIGVRTCFELRAFYSLNLNWFMYWYMYAFLLHSSAASSSLAAVTHDELSALVGDGHMDIIVRRIL